MERDAGGRVAVVTGGAQSIGRAFAIRLAQDGHRIARDGHRVAQDGLRGLPARTGGEGRWYGTAKPRRSGTEIGTLFAQ